MPSSVIKHCKSSFQKEKRRRWDILSQVLKKTNLVLQNHFHLIQNPKNLYKNRTEERKVGDSNLNSIFDTPRKSQRRN